MSYRRTHATHSWFLLSGGNLIANEFICSMLPEKENCITISHGFNNYKSESNFLAHMWQSVRVCGLNIFTLSPLFRWILFCSTFKWHIVTAVGWWPLNHLRQAIIKLCLILGMKQFLNDYSTQKTCPCLVSETGLLVFYPVQLSHSVDLIFGSHSVCLAHLVLQMGAKRGIMLCFQCFQHPASLCRLWFPEQHSVSMVTCQNYYDFQRLLLCNWVWTKQITTGRSGRGFISPSPAGGDAEHLTNT